VRAVNGAVNVVSEASLNLHGEKLRIPNADN
jgi:hypothetical protein